MYCKHKNDKLPGVLFQDRAECGNKFILFWYEIFSLFKYLSKISQKKSQNIQEGLFTKRSRQNASIGVIRDYFSMGGGGSTLISEISRGGGQKKEISLLTQEKRIN